MHTQHIAPAFVQKAWPVVSGFLGSALEHCADEIELSQLKLELVQGRKALLIAVDGEAVVGAAAVGFEDYPNMRVAFVTATGGKFLSSKDIFESLKSWCASQGATSIRGACSEAVARLWRQKFKFEQRYIVVEYKL